MQTLIIFWSEKVIFLILWSSRLGKTTKIHIFSKVEKFHKGKLCLFCKPPVWWKTSPKTSFERVCDFESSGALKNLKIQTFIKDIFWQTLYFWKPWSSKSYSKSSKLYWFCKPFASWKTTQRRLLTKVMVFESFEVWKISKAKFSPFLRCKFQLFWQKSKLLKFLKLEKLFLNINLFIL